MAKTSQPAKNPAPAPSGKTGPISTPAQIAKQKETLKDVLLAQIDCPLHAHPALPYPKVYGLEHFGPH